LPVGSRSDLSGSFDLKLYSEKNATSRVITSLNAEELWFFTPVLAEKGRFLAGKEK
jgi:hypothetical protein